jgi:hypothetical protein
MDGMAPNNSRCTLMVMAVTSSQGVATMSVRKPRRTQEQESDQSMKERALAALAAFHRFQEDDRAAGRHWSASDDLAELRDERERQMDAWH